MRLVKAKLRRYRSIEELDEFAIEPDVTCLVGKNESGKTATLQAMHKSRAVDGTRFDDSLDYPSHRTRELREQEKVPVSDLTYELETADIAAVEAELGDGALRSHQVKVTTGYRYGGTTTWQVRIDETAVVKHLRGDMELPASTWNNSSRPSRRWRGRRKPLLLSSRRSRRGGNPTPIYAQSTF